MRCWLQDLAERGMLLEIFPESDLRLWRYQGCLFWPSSRRRRKSQGLEPPPLKLQSAVGFSNSSVKRVFCEQSHPLSSPSSFSPFITYFYILHGTHCLASLSLGLTRNPLCHCKTEGYGNYCLSCFLGFLCYALGFWFSMFWYMMSASR